ncbi:hypothetical protein K438DRAFT_1967556 [Mycena galopus ATCC 62051]|nr:hypothetical protein K438DRAFT_1967556 [Mycena galopus ATCC 62051]
METLDEWESISRLPALPHDHPCILMTQDEYNHYEDTPILKYPRPSAIEVEEEGESLPSLPWASPTILIPETEFTRESLPDSRARSTGTDVTSHDTSINTDCEGTEAPSPSTVPHDCEATSWITSIRFGLLTAPRDRFVEMPH